MKQQLKRVLSSMRIWYSIHLDMDSATQPLTNRLRTVSYTHLLLFMKVLNWGLVGASASLCIAETVGTLILLTHFWNKQALLSFHFHIPTWNQIKEYVENGFGVGSAFIFQAVVMLSLIHI